MPKITGKTFGEIRVVVDDKDFIDCTFNGTTLVFRGGRIPTFDHCMWNGVRFDFTGPAHNMLTYLRWLRYGPPNGDKLVASLLTLDKKAIN